MKFRGVFLLLAVLFGSTAPAVARDDGYGAMRGPGWGGGRELAPDERREMRRQMREHWQQEHPQPRWHNMDPDERQRLREQMRERRGRPDGDQGERMR